METATGLVYESGDDGGGCPAGTGGITVPIPVQ